MNLSISVRPCKDFSDPINCGLAKGLRRKGIIALVGPYDWHGLFLGIIPVSGEISKATHDVAYKSKSPLFKPTRINIPVKFGWFTNKKSFS